MEGGGAAMSAYHSRQGLDPFRLLCVHDHAQTLEIRFDAAAVFVHGRDTLALSPEVTG